MVTHSLSIALKAMHVFMPTFNERGFKYKNYGSKQTRKLWGRPEWVCDKCLAIFSSYRWLKEHQWDKHAYAVAGVLLLSAFGFDII